MKIIERRGNSGTRIWVEKWPFIILSSKTMTRCEIILESKREFHCIISSEAKEFDCGCRSSYDQAPKLLWDTHTRVYVLWFEQRNCLLHLYRESEQEMNFIDSSSPAKWSEKIEVSKSDLFLHSDNRYGLLMWSSQQQSSKSVATRFPLISGPRKGCTRPVQSFIIVCSSADRY